MKTLSPVLVKELLAPLRKEAYVSKSLIYSGNPEIDAFIFNDPFAFLLGVIADQMVKSETAWSVPYFMKCRLGHLNPALIARTRRRRLELALRKPIVLHRFPARMADFFKKAAEIVSNQYGGNAKEIWNTNSAEVIQKRLCEFSGISQKKSSMMMKMLIRDWDVAVTDKENIDLPYDIHIRRVLLRVGLADNDSLEAIKQAGKKISPDYPADYDDALWLIGRRFCHSRDPDCANCPLNPICAKKVIKI